MRKDIIAAATAALLSGTTAASAIDVGVGGIGVSAGPGGVSAGVDAGGVSAGVGVSAEGVSAGVGADVGGASADVGAGVGTQGAAVGAEADVGGVSVGVAADAGADGVSVGVDASAPGISADVDASASTSGISAGVGAEVGSIGVSVGAEVSEGVSAAAVSTGTEEAATATPFSLRSLLGLPPLKPKVPPVADGAAMALPAILCPEGHCGNNGGGAGAGSDGPVPFVAGASRKLLDACGESLAEAAKPYGKAQVKVSSYGRSQKLDDGGWAAPVFARITYEGKDGREVREAPIVCRFNEAGVVSALAEIDQSTANAASLRNHLPAGR